LLQKGDRVLVGLSGGPDSWALLLGLQRLAGRLELQVEAVYVHHGLRAEADDEAREVLAECQRRGIVCHTIRLTGLQLRSGKVSMDEARTARLDALQRLAKKRRCGRIALGHHADDQAETVLFRIIRGTGLSGLSGIPYQREPFIRPLLDVRRSEIEAFVRKQGIVPVADPSNANQRYARARIRHAILPMLRQENPRIVEALVELSRQARGVGDSPAKLPLHLPRQAARTIEKLRAARSGTRGVDVRGGRVEVRYGEPAFVAGPGTPAVSPVAVTITKSGVYRGANEQRFRIRLACRVRPDNDAVAFDAAALQLPLVLRTREPGDRLALRDGAGRRKLQDLMVDARIPRPERAAWPVLVDGSGTILYVPGFRPSEFARPGAQTRRWLVVENLGKAR